MSYCVGRVVKITLRSCIRMLSRSRECWRQVTAFVCFFLFYPNRRRAAFSTARCGDCAVVVVVVVRMSQRHAFVAYNCSHCALFRFSSSYTSRFSVIVVAVGERLPARDIFVSSIYIRERKLPVRVPVLVDAEVRVRGHTPENVDSEEKTKQKKRKESIARGMSLACGLDYCNLVSFVAIS